MGGENVHSDQVYIHYAKKHLTKYRIILSDTAWGEKTIKENDIATTISQLRNNRDIINQISSDITQEYNFLFSQYLFGKNGAEDFLKIAGDGKTIDITSEAFKELNQKITKRLQSYVNRSAGEQVLQRMQSKGIKDLINKIANNAGKSSYKNDLDKLIETIIEAIQLIDPQINPQFNSNGELEALVKKQTKVKTKLNSETLSNLLKHIQNLSKNIEGNIKDGKTAEEIKNSLSTNIFNVIFSTDIGEEIYLISTSDASDTANMYMKNLVKNFTGKVTYSSPYADGLKTVGGKADNILRNCKFTYRDASQGKIKTVILDIGISDKFYKGGNWLGSNNKSDNFIVDTGSAGQLGPILKNILATQNDPFLWYCLYNGARHDDNRWNDNIATLVTSRVILRALSTTYFSKQGGINKEGQYDFAGYIIINGRVISVLSIVNYVLNILNNTALSFQRNSQNTGTISIHFQRPKSLAWDGSQYPQIKPAIKRSMKELEQLQKTKIEVKLHMQKLLSVIK